MLISYVELKEKIENKTGKKVSMSVICSILGKSRTHIIEFLKKGDMINIKDYEYIKLCQEYPDYFKFPHDFFDYTVQNLYLNYYINNKTFRFDKLLKSKTRIEKTKGISNIYSMKDEILKIFNGEFYTPYVLVGEYYEKYEKPKKELRDFNEEELAILQQNNIGAAIVSKEEWLASGGDEDEFVKYTIMNVRCNMFFNKVSIKKLHKLLGISEYHIYDYMKRDSTKYSLVRYKEKLDIIFNPYIFVL